MSDRLEEIKKRYEGQVSFLKVLKGEMDWLIAEIERLRGEVCKLDSILGEMGYWNQESKDETQ
jgi:hypothetical protein